MDGCQHHSGRVLILAIAFIAASLSLDRSAQAKTGTYRVALIHVTYSDTTPVYTPAQLKQAAAEIHTYFQNISYNQLDMEITPVEVTLNNSREFYFNQCQPSPQETRNPCPPTLIEDAAQAAAANGASFNGVNGISVLSTFCSGDVTNGTLAISRPGVNGTFQRSYDFECSGPPPGPSGVLWGGWAHEIGHQLEITDYGASIFGWGIGGHPSSYSSGYDQMDSCYPCDTSAYSLLDAPIMTGSEKVFSGWMPGNNVVTINAPNPGTTVVLTPLESNFTSIQANQAIKVPISPGVYYLIEARRRLLADSLQNYGQPPRGIYDEGVHIDEIEETRDPPMKPVNSCDTIVSGGCVYQQSDSRFASCNATTRPAYCWPFALWHVGDTFTDNANAIQVKIQSAVGNGFAVTVSRGTQPGHPNAFVIPWLTPPMNTYETIDIWVDSSCNGYESDVGSSGLRYGRRADGTVIGNGDDPCADHENRIYARIHNIGDAAANNVVVHFQVSNPLGVGVTGSWTDLGQVTIPTIAPGATTSLDAASAISIPWTPVVNLTAGQVAQGHFKFHSCIQVIIDSAASEIIIGDNQAQENFDDFEAVLGLRKKYGPIQGHFFIHRLKIADAKEGFQTYFLNVTSRLPKTWSYSIANGQKSLTLAAGTTVDVPVDIKVPAGTPIGKSYYLSVQALTLTTMTNPAIPPSEHISNTHNGMTQVGGVALSAQTVLPDSLSIAAKIDNAGNIITSGVLSPRTPALVAVDFVDPHGKISTRLAHTDQSGKFQSTIEPCVGDATWTVRALWQGNIRYSSVISPPASVLVPRVAKGCKDRPEK